jgi:hypothetical protein
MWIWEIARDMLTSRPIEHQIACEQNNQSSVTQITSKHYTEPFSDAPGVAIWLLHGVHTLLWPAVRPEPGQGGEEFAHLFTTLAVALALGFLGSCVSKTC